MNGLTPEEKITALNYAVNGADFMFMPSPELRSKIALGCPESTGLNYVVTSILIEGKPVRLDSQMILKYCKGTLDGKNTWLFNNGNIKVVPHQLKQPEKLKPKEDITKKEENNDE